ncbi:MAG: hypothetical protein RRY33_04150 [Alistipes sp.]
MKKIAFLTLLALTMLAINAFAQNIALGERAPETKPAAWLAGQQPSAAELSYIEFFHASNKASLTALEQLQKLTHKLGTKLRVIIVTQEKEDKISPLLTPYLSSQISVALDGSGKIFAAFGVNYVPFGVLTDSRNRVLWMGNSLQLTEDVIHKNSR